MKKPFVALFLLVGAAAMVANTAFAQIESGNGDLGSKLVNAKGMREALSSRAQRLRVSAGPDPDTVWFGHSYTDHWNATGNYWNLYTGVNFAGSINANNAIWDWDHSTGLSNHGIGDSLTGWWPFRRAYNQTGGLTLPDVSRPWWALDIGNSINYTMNAGPGGQRTKGVVGLWHADAGSAVGLGVTWTPLSGTKSAWCGLRELHDPGAVIDKVTGNPFDASIHELAGEQGLTLSPKRFPGYVSQMDQLLFRDIAAPAATPLSVSFMYRTRMSTSATTTASTRTGWFHGDPLAVVTGNYISSTDAGAATPVDSFSVYVGAPVNDAACKYSDGVTRPVFDPQRRWFSEVIRIFEGAGVPYYEIFTTAGSVPADTATATPTFSVSIPAVNVDAIRNATGNTSHNVRLVFRVKTNRGFDDGDSGASGFTSFSRGAALIDNVIVNGTNIGDFEGVEQGGTNTIDNRAGASALTNWKSTGKPPAIYMHLRNLADLTYNDLCGPPDSPSRQCNIFNTVMTCGNNDDNERAADSRFLSHREVLQGILSPTINFKTAGPGIPNAQGLTNTIVDATDDYYIWYDFYAGMFNLQFTGEGWAFGSQAYPNTQAGNGGVIWGSLLTPGFQIFNPEPQCFSDIEQLNANGLLFTSNPGNVPDSLRIMMLHLQSCFRFAVSLGCNSSDGGYFDNISLGFVDVPDAAQVSSSNAITVGAISADIWQFINDAFPQNETPGLAGTAAFDTAGAELKGGINNAQSTGNALRFDIPADTIAIKASNVAGSTDTVFGNQTRVDMIFRILPGPGNYKNVGGRTFPPTGAMTLLQLPQNQANVAVSGDGSFWGQYMAAPGTFSAGNHHSGAFWDYLTWNSARCDTSEFNVFPVVGKITTGLTAGSYTNTYNENDPKFATLGITKFKCFVVDTALAASQTNIICDGTVPAWLTVVPPTRTGYNGVNTTKEFTKIIPDGLLTPGAHVQYFFRKSALANPPAFTMCPDTETVSPQNSEGSTDGHRWQQFGVLPDRWKDAAFGGTGMACMLYVDINDRRGNEKVWVSVMDSIGGTASNKWGADNGWHAPGGPTPTGYLGLGAGSNPAITVVGKNQQPGTTWDMYGVKASESLTTSSGSPGNRYANRASMALATGKEARIGPTKEVLRQYYRVLAVLSGDLNSGILGPFTNRSPDDIEDRKSVV